MVKQYSKQCPNHLKHYEESSEQKEEESRNGITDIQLWNTLLVCFGKRIVILGLHEKHYSYALR